MIRHGTRDFRRTNLALFAAGLATMGLLYCVQPMMPILSRDFGVTAAAGALSLSLPTAFLAVGILFGGELSDRWGRKRVMSASLLCSSLVMTLAAMAPNWSTLLMLRALVGLSLSGIPSVAMTYLAEEIHPDSIGLGMGLYISGNAIGGLAGRLAAGCMTDWYGWRAGIAAAAILGGAASVMFMLSLPPSRQFKPQRLLPTQLRDRYLNVFRDAGLPWLFVEGGLMAGSFITVYNYTGYRLMAAPFNLSQSAVGGIFSVYLLGMLSSTLIGHLAGRLGRRKVLWPLVALMLVGVGLTLVTSVWGICCGIAVLTIGFFAGHSVASSWVGRRSGPAKAQASSVYLFCYYVGASVDGVLGGLFYQSFGWPGVVVFTVAVLLIAQLIAVRLYYLTPLPVPRRPAQEPQILT